MANAYGFGRDNFFYSFLFFLSKFLILIFCIYFCVRFYSRRLRFTFYSVELRSLFSVHFIKIKFLFVLFNIVVHCSLLSVEFGVSFNESSRKVFNSLFEQNVKCKMHVNKTMEFISFLLGWFLVRILLFACILEEFLLLSKVMLVYNV